MVVSDAGSAVEGPSGGRENRSRGGCDRIGERSKLDAIDSKDTVEGSRLGDESAGVRNPATTLKVWTVEMAQLALRGHVSVGGAAAGSGNKAGDGSSGEADIPGRMVDSVEGTDVYTTSARAKTKKSKGSTASGQQLAGKVRTRQKADFEITDAGRAEITKCFGSDEAAEARIYYGGEAMGMIKRIREVHASRLLVIPCNTKEGFVREAIDLATDIPVVLSHAGVRANAPPGSHNMYRYATRVWMAIQIGPEVQARGFRQNMLKLLRVNIRKPELKYST